MAFALYYEAKRENQITAEEQAVCQEIVDRYCAEYDFKRKKEDFCVYDLDKDTDVIFSGSTKLPGGGPNFMFEVANYWLECLTEITAALGECEWNVTFDDVDLVFDEEEGWRFPTDEEYNQQKMNKSEE